MKALLAIGMLALVAPLAGWRNQARHRRHPEGVDPYQGARRAAAAYVGKTLRIDGVATAVCTHMGCWMAVAAEGGRRGPGEETSAPTVRLKVDDGVIVFPVTAKGRKVSAEGVFEAVGGAGDSKDAAQRTRQARRESVAAVSAEGHRRHHSVAVRHEESAIA